MSETIGFIPPAITPEAEEYWKGARRGKLLYQRCKACGGKQFPFLTLCRNCMSDELEATASSGKGKVVTFSAIYRAPSPAFQDRVPYTVALIELEEGYRMLSAFSDTPPEEISIDMPVKVLFEPFGEDYALPLFESA